MNINDMYSGNPFDIKNRPKGNGRISEKIRDFNNPHLTTVAALARVEKYVEQEKDKANKEFEIGE